MDFTMNMIDGNRGSIPVSQAAALAAMAQEGSVVTYQAHQAHQTGTSHHHPTTHLISIPTNHQQGHQVTVAAVNQHQELRQHHHAHQQAQLQALHDEDVLTDTKPQDIAKDENDASFTPPPRVNSVGSVASHPDSRAEKGTDTNDFEPYIKIEIRGHVPGITAADKDKNSVMQLHFNSINEVLQFFSQRPVSQIDAFNLLNPDLVRNINPDLVRNHFLYVPSAQENVRVTTNGFTSNAATVTQTQNFQNSTSSPIIVASGSLPATSTNIKPRPIKTERRRGEVPPGTIINKTPPIEANPNQFVCWMCGLNLQKSLPFEEHMVEQHSIEKPYRCEDCGVTFKQKAHIDRHRRIHLPTRPYQCGVCGKGFTRNEHVRRHSFTHSGEKPYHCPTCNKTFSRQQQLTKHLLTHTKPPRPDSPQPTHPHGLTTTLLLQTTDQNGRLLTINQAGTQMTASMPQGMMTAGTPAGIVTTVSHAGNGSSRGLKANGEPAARPYQCGVCGKAFIRNEHLRRHMLIHSGEKPHCCNMCGKAFPRREHLSKHMRSHAPKDASLGTIGALQTSTPTSMMAVAAAAAAATAAVVSHATLQPVSAAPTIAVAGNGTPVSLSALTHSLANGGLSAGGVSVVTSNQQPLVTHSGAGMSTSHSSTSHAAAAAAAAHLPPGTHYLPMFGLLAEVV